MELLSQVSPAFQLWGGQQIPLWLSQFELHLKASYLTQGFKCALSNLMLPTDYQINTISDPT